MTKPIPAASDIVQAGRFIGTRENLAKLAPAATLRRIKSWQSGISPATSKAILGAACAERLATEAVFDAAHGRRYLCFVYSVDGGMTANRRAVWDAYTAPGAVREA